MDDILVGAGAELEEEDTEYSPSMVKMNKDIMDETF